MRPVKVPETSASSSRTSTEAPYQPKQSATPQTAYGSKASPSAAAVVFRAICVDGHKGFPDTINTMFPQTDAQLYVVHQIRNSLKYVVSKNQKEFLADVMFVYQAATLEQADTELSNFDSKWGEKYSTIIRSWLDNLQNLSRYFQYTTEIRKVTKTKSVFSSD